MADNVSGAVLADAPFFDDAIRAAAAHHGMLPELVRRDYWVTRVLRAIATDSTLAGQAIFKGGTSLSKGWKLIDRFSEDVDLLLTGPELSEPPAARKDRKLVFTALKRRLEEDTLLRLPQADQFERDQWEWYEKERAYSYQLRYPLPGKAAARDGSTTDWLLVESGFRGGAHPHERRALTSLVAEFIETRDEPETFAPYTTDLAPFEMNLLRPERTFAEKLFAVHSALLTGEDGAQKIAIRHYYDLAQLYARSADVQRALAEREVGHLIREAARISNIYFSGAFDLDDLKLRESPALAPPDTLARVLRRKYEDPNEESLYYKSRPNFDEILATMLEIRDRL